MNQTKPNPPFLDYGFRPFFFGAAVWAVAAVALWIGTLVGWPTLPAGIDGLAWHQHEIVYGFLAAAVTGFILTALPNWTGRSAVSGWNLGLLALLWAFGRAANLLVGTLLPEVVMIIDLAFPVALVVIVGRDVVTSRNWRNAVPAGLIALFMSGNAASHLEDLGHWNLQISGERISMLVLMILLALIAGRIVPSFTRNWLAGRGNEQLPAEFGLVDRLSLGALVLFALSYIALGEGRFTAGISILAALLHAARLVRWRGWLAVSEPLVWILHIAYIWMIVALGLFAASALSVVPETAALHALGSGLFATMILAVATRASLGHSGRALTAGPATTIIYLLIFVAALTRVASPIVGGDVEELLRNFSAITWIGAFLLFAIIYFPIWVRPRQDV